jgi:predicted enzyme related to lactoylglutathione lyase
MIYGAHFLLYSKDPDADRAFFRDVLQLRFIDDGHGWLIFALPPAELAVHPSEQNFVQKHAEHELMGSILYLMCDDLTATIQSLTAKNVSCAPAVKAEWGAFTIIRLPSGGEIGLYQPTHTIAVEKFPK